MEYLKVDNKVAIYLDHRSLVNKMYNESALAGSVKYYLKRELFDFKQKPLTELRPVKAGTKRKAAVIEEADVTGELKELELRSQIFLKTLKSKVKFTELDAHKDLPRCWEECVDYPSFNGGNATLNFQSACICNQNYIIPPKCRFFNADVADLPTKLKPTEQFDLIVIDPPWRNKYISRLKRKRPSLGYHMLCNKQIKQIPIARLIHKRTIVAIWCTNSKLHQKALMDHFLPAWKMRLLHTLKWLKLNTSGDLIGRLRTEGHKQPFEVLYLACHEDCNGASFASIQDVELLMSIPSIVHSHKPPLLPWLEQYLNGNPKCLELFARYLQPEFTSFGLEVLKLMDKRLYSSSSGDEQT